MEMYSRVQRQHFIIQCLTIASWSPFLPATHICIFCSCCVFDMAASVFCSAPGTPKFGISDCLCLCLCQQPVATIFGNFYVNRITHPTSTLKIHKYFSAVNWEFARLRTQSTRKNTENVTHFNDNAYSGNTAPKGCKSLIFVRMKWMF